jgi:hypothetical protein
MCRATFNSIVSSLFFSEDGASFSLPRQIIAAHTPTHLSADPEVCLVAESCQIMFSGNFSGNQFLQANQYAVDGCIRTFQSLECTFVFDSVGSAIVNIIDSFSNFSTQIAVAPKLRAQFWPSSVVLRSDPLRIFIAVLDFLHKTLHSKFYNNTVQCFRSNNGNFSRLFECDFRHLSEVVSESFSFFVGPSSRALQHIGSIRVLTKPEISSIVPSQVKANYPQTISIVGRNFDASFNISCLVLGYVTTASVLNSKYLLCPNVVFSSGNSSISIKYNEMVLESFVISATTAARVLQFKAMNVSGRFLRVMLRVDTKMEISTLHAKINSNHLTCSCNNFSVICDYHQYSHEQHFTHFLLSFDDQGILGEILIDRVELMNVVQFMVPRSSVLSSTGSLITLTGSFPSSSGHISVGPNVIQYQTLSNTNPNCNCYC